MAHEIYGIATREVAIEAIDQPTLLEPGALMRRIPDIETYHRLLTHMGTVMLHGYDQKRSLEEDARATSSLSSQHLTELSFFELAAAAQADPLAYILPPLEPRPEGSKKLIELEVPLGFVSHATIGLCVPLGSPGVPKIGLLTTTVALHMPTGDSVNPEARKLFRCLEILPKPALVLSRRMSRNHKSLAARRRLLSNS